MGPAIILLGMLLSPSAGQDVPVRHVPQAVDSTFSRRNRLCPNGGDRSGVSRANDARLSAAQLLGAITAVDVHQYGSHFVDFVAVQTYLREQLVQQPRTLYRSIPWAEATPLAATGVVGTLHFATGSTGVFEATDVHLCAQDSAGDYWWLRLAPVDLWPAK